MISAFIKKHKKESFLITIAFLLLIPSFYSDYWNILSDDNYNNVFEESLFIGRLAKSDKDGVFSRGGLPGVVYDKEEVTATFSSPRQERTIIIEIFKEEQEKYLLKEKNAPDDYMPY